MKPAATAQVQAAAKPLNKAQSNPGKVVAVATTRLPASLEFRITKIEARITAVEQLTICPMACARERCAFRCPTAGGVR
ncbi:MAG: hypothetical protein WCP59_18050 [Actinomycetota bacterium]